jgi:hypothetical protein
MNKISIETNFGFGMIFLLPLWAAVFGKIPFTVLLILPFTYAIMYFFISIFIWDKRKTAKITMVASGFKKGEVFKIGSSGKQVIIMDVKQIDARTILCTTFPIKISKYRIVNVSRAYYRNFSFFLRSIIK